MSDPGEMNLALHSDTLRVNQRQLDADGSEVGVSRQALDETLDEVDGLRLKVIKLKAVNEELIIALKSMMELVTHHDDSRPADETCPACLALDKAIAAIEKCGA